MTNQNPTPQVVRPQTRGAERSDRDTQNVLAGYLPAPDSRPEPDTPHVYVACLASYNNGHLHGRWITAALGEAHICDETRAMLAASPIPNAEEWAIHDYDGFEGTSVCEWASFESVAHLAEFITKHDELGGKLVEHFCGDIDDAKAALEHYHGEYESLEDYARQLTEDCGPKIPEDLERYIDYKSMARDWEMSGDIFTIETAIDEIHIFGAW